MSIQLQAPPAVVVTPAYTIMPIDHRPFSARLALAARPLEQEGQWRGFRASGLSGCLRQAGYRLLGIAPVDVTYNLDWEIEAAMGTTAHEYLQRHLVASGMVWTHPVLGPAIELTLKDNCHPDQRVLLERYRLGGHIDAVVRQRDGTLAILDIKTVKSKHMASDDKAQGYAVQLHTYMHFFATPAGEQARVAFVLKISRDDPSQRVMYRIAYQSAVFAGELARLEAAHVAVEAGQLPVPEPARGFCRGCGWRSHCQPTGGK